MITFAVQLGSLQRSEKILPLDRGQPGPGSPELLRLLLIEHPSFSHGGGDLPRWCEHEQRQSFAGLILRLSWSAGAWPPHRARGLGMPQSVGRQRRASPGWRPGPISPVPDKFHPDRQGQCRWRRRGPQGGGPGPQTCLLLPAVLPDVLRQQMRHQVAHAAPLLHRPTRQPLNYRGGHRDREPCAAPLLLIHADCCQSATTGSNLLQ